MERRGLVEFLQDISRSIDAIDRFVVGVDFESFAMNEEKATAVIKKLEIIGEAVKQVPEDIRSQYPDIPWRSNLTHLENLDRSSLNFRFRSWLQKYSLKESGYAESFNELGIDFILRFRICRGIWC